MKTAGFLKVGFSPIYPVQEQVRALYPDTESSVGSDGSYDDTIIERCRCGQVIVSVHRVGYSSPVGYSCVAPLGSRATWRTGVSRLARSVVWTDGVLQLLLFRGSHRYTCVCYSFKNKVTLLSNFCHICENS